MRGIGTSPHFLFTQGTCLRPGPAEFSPQWAPPILSDGAGRGNPCTSPILGAQLAKTRFDFLAADSMRVDARPAPSLAPM
jgi:hypothetical protein